VAETAWWCLSPRDAGVVETVAAATVGVEDDGGAVMQGRGAVTLRWRRRAGGASRRS